MAIQKFIYTIVFSLTFLAAHAVAQSPDFVLCAGNGDPDDAIAACTRAIRSSTATRVNLAAAYTNRGFQFSRKNDHVTAVQDYLEATRLNPKDPQTWTNLGASYTGLGNFQKSIESHTEVIRLVPNHKDAWYNRGSAHKSLGNKELAISDLRQALKINPNDDEARAMLKQLGVNE